MRQTAFLLVFASLVHLAWGQEWKFSQEQLDAQLGVFLHNPSNTIGSAFAFGRGKDVITCAHVATANSTPDCWFRANGPMHRLKLKYILPKYDLAVYTPSPAIAGEPLKTGDFKKIRPGDTILYWGWNTLKKSRMVNLAKVSAIGSMMNDGVTVDFLEFEGEGLPGYSGGPVFNDRTEIVAVMREAWTKRGIKGGKEILINRAVSAEILTVLDTQVFRRIEFLKPPDDTNKSAITVTEPLDVERLLEKNGATK
jgi:hypothetical protein